MLLKKRNLLLGFFLILGQCMLSCTSHMSKVYKCELLNNPKDLSVQQYSSNNNGRVFVWYIKADRISEELKSSLAYKGELEAIDKLVFKLKENSYKWEGIGSPFPIPSWWNIDLTKGFSYYRREIAHDKPDKFNEIINCFISKDGKDILIIQINVQ